MILSLSLQNQKPSIVWSILCILFAIAKKMGYKTTQLLFDVMVAIISTTGVTYTLMLSYIRHLNLSGFHGAEKAVARQMNQGRIPSVMLLFCLLPFIVTPAGMTIKLAKGVVLYNSVMFALIFNNIWEDRTCEDISCSPVFYETKRVNLVIDLTMHTTIIIVAWFGCISAAEIGNQFIKRMDSDIQADAILNNVLKNSIAGAACLLEIEQEELEVLKCGKCGVRPRLAEARNQLIHSMHWCMSRQMMVDLASGCYASIRTDVNLALFLKNVSTSIDHCDIKLGDECEEGKKNNNNNHVFKFDESMAHIAVQNSLFNAMHHGDKGIITLEAQVSVDGNVVFLTNLIIF
jgi:hypothetical protein